MKLYIKSLPSKGRSICVGKVTPILPVDTVQVALSMVKAGKSVNVGHHIPYVMCNIPEAKSPAEKARHPDDVLRSDGQLEVDVEW